MQKLVEKEVWELEKQEVASKLELFKHVAMVETKVEGILKLED